jgi:hypothetical protein
MKFTQSQRGELRKLRWKLSQKQSRVLGKNSKLYEEEINCLEGLLPLFHAQLSELPTLTGIRDKLSALSKPLVKANKVLATMSAAQSAAGREAYSRILMSAAAESGEHEEALHGASVALEWLASVVGRAQQSLGSKQRQRPAVDWRLIRQIEAALLSGLMEHFLGRQPRPTHWRRIKTSRAASASRRTSPFRSIVVILLRAAGAAARQDADKATRAYIAIKKRLAEECEVATLQLEGMTFQEIATRMKIPLEAVVEHSEAANRRLSAQQTA